MKMAKPSEDDLLAASDLATILWELERGHMPSASNVEAFSETFEQNDGEHYKRVMNAILQAAARGWRERVALGTAHAPRNKVVDPEAEIEREPDLWVWQYSNGTFSSATFKDRRACELNTLPNAAGQPVALYLHPPPLRMPVPMSEDELVEIYRALPKNGRIVRDESTTIRLGRAIEAEVMRRVQEANK